MIIKNQKDLFDTDKPFEGVDSVKLSKHDTYYCNVLDENDKYILVQLPNNDRLCWRKPVFDRRTF